MNRRRIPAVLLAIVNMLAAGQAAAGDAVLVAVASNFLSTAEEIADAFETDTGHPVRLSSGSTGKLYAQIVNGAPYDVFLSADAERPERLADDGLAIAESRFTYAEGRLLLFAARIDGDCVAALEMSSGRIAIANPELAPYGRAAREFLQARGLWEDASLRLVIGENIAQALQFATVGGADFGIVANTQRGALPAGGCRWLVPARWHRPIEQQAVVLTRARDKPAAQRFLDYLQADPRKLIEAVGYGSAADAR